MREQLDLLNPLSRRSGMVRSMGLPRYAIGIGAEPTSRKHHLPNCKVRIDILYIDPWIDDSSRGGGGGEEEENVAVIARSDRILER
jgi:hypothetical protein